VRRSSPPAPTKLRRQAQRRSRSLRLLPLKRAATTTLASFCRDWPAGDSPARAHCRPCCLWQRGCTWRRAALLAVRYAPAFAGGTGQATRGHLWRRRWDVPRLPAFVMLRHCQAARTACVAPCMSMGAGWLLAL